MKKYLLALSIKSIILMSLCLIFGILCDLIFGKGGILIFILGFASSLTPLIIDNEGVKYLLRYRCLEYEKQVVECGNRIISEYSRGISVGKDELAMNFINLSNKMSQANIHGLELKFCPKCKSFHISDLKLGTLIMYCDNCHI